MAVAKSLVETEDNIDDFMNKINKNFIQTSDDFKGRAPGRSTVYYIEELKKNKNDNILAIDNIEIKSGGSGSAMRTSCIGLAFSGEKNRDKLIDYSILSSMVTHKSPIGYLGGFASALFTALAIENVDINKWPFILIDFIKSDKIKKFTNMKHDTNQKEYDKIDYQKFLDMWELYVSIKFKNGIPVKQKSQKNLVLRTKFHYDNFTSNDPNSTIIGENGYSSVIMAYDSLLDAGNCWEKLIIYICLHVGDSDTVGSIATSFYGALYGFHNIPEGNLKYLEYKDQLYKLGSDLYKKYYS
jgi:ADP-ribosylarginine hydrolase